MWSFSGIPYARPPVGPLRWRPPEPAVPWSGVREAAEFGKIAPQPPPTPGVAIPGDPLDQDEDCLTLNVWAPDPLTFATTSPTQRGKRGGRPVMVWVHGGGFTAGTGASLLYRGGDLARNCDVVVVTINYRLGALGFLTHPALADSGSSSALMGNWGLLDQVAALRWVQDNIAAFGGDPGNVTVFGESAGAMSISVLLASPMCRGLFQRAIVQSGPPYTHSLERSKHAAEELAAILGHSKVTRAALHSVPPSELVAATQELQNRLPPPGELPLPFLPVVDGAFLPIEPIDAIAAGAARGVTLMTGTNRDELTFFSLADTRLANMDEDGLLRWLSRVHREIDSRVVVDAYRTARMARGEPTTPRSLWIAAGSDFIFRRPSMELASAHSAHQQQTYTYLFTWETPAFAGQLGSCHALEIPFVFGSLRHPAISLFAGNGSDAAALSASMQRAWASFARSGDPSHPGIGTWLTWDPQRRATMVFGPTGGLQYGPRADELAVWQLFLPSRGVGP